MNTTRHASKRTKERVGIKKKAVDRLRDIAFDIGVKHNEVSGRFKKYFDYLYFSHETANNVRVHGDFVWVFGGETLITVFPLPNQFKNAAKKARGKR